ncbi:serine hydrolase domain-containing protein [Polyangium sp. y55x31]|uniref:serine hydrolase domain-containing protein n=1 Tax=Polyangium sp. y55x31 TaxID=3042688 RepID=UPI002482C6BB|nr:serine hydrolase domain-containing protein [Polyangium sp. y55x31]MDI1476725.1 serine hydrolase domain-containing protein [Polyangium sp. y55x31]
MRKLPSALVASGLGSLALLVASNSPAAPPQVHPDAINLASILDDHTVVSPGTPGAADTPGMIAAVVAGNHIIAKGHAGWARLGAVNPVAMTHDAVFNIGSISKSITALALAKLIDSGVVISTSPTVYLSWDTKLSDALGLAPDYFHRFFSDDTDRANVTLRQVAAHRSGYDCATRIYSHDFPNNWQTKTRPQLARDYLVGTVAANIGAGQYPNGALGDCYGAIGTYEYENLNFFILQAVINKWLPAGVHDYTEYVKEYVVEPHGMDVGWAWGRSDLMAATGLDYSSSSPSTDNYWNAHFFPDPVWASGHHYPRYYNSSWTVTPINAPAYGNGASLYNNAVDSIATGAGGFAFTVYDFARYATLLLRDRSAAVQQVRERDYSVYNFGWESSVISSSPLLVARGYHHNGAISAGSYAKIWFSPELDLAYISFANGGAAPGSANEDVQDVMMDGIVPVDTGGCADTDDVKHVQRFYNQRMFGCAGSVTYTQASSLCKTGYHVCTAAEYATYNQYGTASVENAEAPMDHYWTSTNLKYTGSSSGNCSATTAAGAYACDTNEPMRVCSPTATYDLLESAYRDTQGNYCNWINCGYGGSTTNRYFGGCSGNTTAGTLCCETVISGPPQ